MAPAAAPAAGLQSGSGGLQGLDELGRRQAELHASIKEVEKAVAQTRQHLAEIFLQRCQELRDEKRKQVDEFLAGKDGRDWFETRRARLLEGPATDGEPLTVARAEEQVFAELMHDPQERVEQKASQELEPRFREVAWSFRAKGAVLLEALEAIETRAVPFLEALHCVPSGPAMLRASGFIPGLAGQIARRLPMLRGGGVSDEDACDDNCRDVVAGASVDAQGTPSA